MPSMDPSSFQLLLRIVNDPRSWFGAPEFSYEAVETRDAGHADWIVAIENESNLKKINFGGLSVTYSEKNRSGQ